MLRLIIWAMATGFVTGAVWFAIHFFRRGIPEGGVPSAIPPARHRDPPELGAPHAQPLNAADRIAQERPAHALPGQPIETVEPARTPRP